MTPLPKDFPPGSRVKFTPRETEQANSLYMASLGIEGLYVDLRQPLTGTVGRELPGYYTDMIHFRPDGWPLPDGVLPDGFLAHVSQVGEWDPGAVAVRCQVVNGVGEKVTKSEAERLVSEKLEKEGPDAFTKL